MITKRVRRKGSERKVWGNESMKKEKLKKERGKG